MKIPEILNKYLGDEYKYNLEDNIISCLEFLCDSLKSTFY